MPDSGKGTIRASQNGRTWKAIWPWSLLAVLIAAGAVIWTTLPATTAGPRSIVQLVVGTPSITVNGLSWPLDVAPFIEQGRTWVPVRFVSEALAAEVSWDAASQTVTIAQRDRVLRIAIGSKELVEEGKGNRAMDVAPFIRQGRTWVPVRFVSEALGAEVNWSEAEQKVTISVPGELGFVSHVEDGRTFQTQLPDGPFTVRLIGIQPPSQGDPYYEQAVKTLKEMVEGRSLSLERDTTLNDRDGRLLRWAFFGKTCINEEMVRLGAAFAQTQYPDIRYARQMLTIEQGARQNQVGFWAPPPPPPPPPPATPSPTPSPSATQTSYRVAIVIDDFGYNMFEAQPLLDSPDPITLAILPGIGYCTQIADQAAVKGKQVILHCPMENALGVAETILTSMSEEQVRHRLEENLKDVPGAVGVSNHMGSIATANAQTMRYVLKYIKERGLFFLDSRTAHDSVVLEVAAELGTPALANKVFLDNQGDPDYVRGRLALLKEVALRDGTAVGIGHVRTAGIADLIHAAVISWQADGVQLVPLSQLLP
jgi:polysaccharide deacetylase 2 family uncharacterized protein YibQ/endonuclease YncB( thermonuclease family)